MSDEQPRDDVGTGCCCGMEAALRWTLPMTTGCEAEGACLTLVPEVAWSDAEEGGWGHVIKPRSTADWHSGAWLFRVLGA